MNLLEKCAVAGIGRENLPSTILFIVEKSESQFKAINEAAGKYEPWQLVAVTAASTYLGCKFYYFYIDLDKGLIDYMKKEAFKLARKIPYINNKISAEINKTKVNIYNDVLKSNKGTLFLTDLPAFGQSDEQILNTIDSYRKLGPVDWKDGMLSGCVYGADDVVTDLVTKVYSRFAWANPMHADIFPDVRKMEAELIRFTCNLYNGGEEACGTMSSGGTESIMLACRAYRELAASKGIKRPEMVCPQTCHAAFTKASNYFKIKLHLVDVDPVTMKADIKKMESYINSNTCMIAGSAPNFPNGAMDPIEELSQLALKYKIPLHVDACLGGFLIPFMEQCGYKTPCIFDFRLPGVTSISVDTHKYGYTPKGSSVIMYRNYEYRRFQFFECVNWSGGIYVSPTFAGSRAGSLVAMTWATLMHYGKNGYLDATKKIMETRDFVYEDLLTIPNIYVMAKPDVSVIAFNSHDLNILNVYDKMTELGWHLNAIQNPTGIHIAITKLHTQPGVKERFCKDIRSTVKAVMESPDRNLGKTAAIYCSTQGVPDKSLIVDVAYLFLDACYSTDNSKIKQ